MAEILIEGASPNSFIATGERRLVTPTKVIHNLLRNGFAKVVPRENAPEPAAAAQSAEPAKPKRRPRKAAAKTATKAEPASESDQATGTDKAPDDEHTSDA